MSSQHGPGGKNSNYGWANREEKPEDPAVTAWIAALWAKPCTWEEYEEQRRLAASRNQAKQTRAGGKGNGRKRENRATRQ